MNEIFDKLLTQNDVESLTDGIYRSRLVNFKKDCKYNAKDGTYMVLTFITLPEPDTLPTEFNLYFSTDDADPKLLRKSAINFRKLLLAANLPLNTSEDTLNLMGEKVFLIGLKVSKNNDKYNYYLTSASCE